MPWDCLKVFSIHQITRCLHKLGQSPPALVVVRLSLRVSLWCLRSLSPSCAPCVPEGSHTCVRVCCKVSSLPQGVLMVSSVPQQSFRSPHTLECLRAPGPAFPVRSLPSPSPRSRHRLLVQIGCCFKCENNCSKAIKPE